jgi:hypothetical protein
MANHNARNLLGIIGLIWVASSWPTVAKEPLQDTLDPKYVKTGATVSERDCSTLKETVWVVVEGRGDCIRYYGSGLKAFSNKTVFVWFHGDRVQRQHAKGDFFKTTGQQVIGYTDNRPQILNVMMAAWVAEFGRPAMFIGRPGVYGSSGDHTKKRQPREIALMDKALDALKSRYRIESFIAGGQSGGGHVTASLLAQRTDIECAVLTSAPAAVRARNEIMRWPGDATGMTTFYDPIEHVDEIRGHAGLRIFVVGDPRDKAVPFSTQERYFEALKARRLNAYLVTANGSGQRFHGLGPLGMRMAGWCALGQGSDEIVRRAKTEVR